MGIGYFVESARCQLVCMVPVELKYCGAAQDGIHGESRRLCKTSGVFIDKYAVSQRQFSYYLPKAMPIVRSRSGWVRVFGDDFAHGPHPNNVCVVERAGVQEASFMDFHFIAASVVRIC